MVMPLGTPQGRDEEEGHEIPGRETRTKNWWIWDTPGERYCD